MIDVRCVTITCLQSSNYGKPNRKRCVHAYECNHPPFMARLGTLYNILPKIILKVTKEVIKFVFKTKVRMSI